MNIKDFLGQFSFRPELEGYIGIERERFLATLDGEIAPRAKEFLDLIGDPQWTYELSACQVEDRTRPRKTTIGVWPELLRNDIRATRVAKKLELRLISIPVGPPNMPYDIYPTPRYEQIAEHISQEQLHAACRVAGIHIHVGMRDMNDAVQAYNDLRKHLDELCTFGDRSKGERLRLYKIMAPNWSPPEIKNPEHFFEIAKEQNFYHNPRNCYWLIRISTHGTVELRMFDTPKTRRDILVYADNVKNILTKEYYRRHGWPSPNGLGTHW